MATTGTILAEEREASMFPEHQEEFQNVWQTLRESGSMAFLELSYLTHLRHDELRQIVNDLQEKDLVKVRNPDDIRQAIITIKHRAVTGFAANAK